MAVNILEMSPACLPETLSPSCSRDAYDVCPSRRPYLCRVPRDVLPPDTPLCSRDGSRAVSVLTPISAVLQGRVRGGSGHGEPVPEQPRGDQPAADGEQVSLSTPPPPPAPRPPQV